MNKTEGRNDKFWNHFYFTTNQSNQHNTTLNTTNPYSD